jgi:hypothetical protein
VKTSDLPKRLPISDIISNHKCICLFDNWVCHIKIVLPCGVPNLELYFSVHEIHEPHSHHWFVRRSLPKHKLIVKVSIEKLCLPWALETLDNHSEGVLTLSPFNLAVLSLVTQMSLGDFLFFWCRYKFLVDHLIIFEICFLF